MTRLIPFQAIDNFRDFGDYPAAGRRLKRGLLYRSAHHASATAADLDRLAGLGISVIVDLRRAGERARAPSRRWAGCAARVIESDVGRGEPGDWSAFIAGGELELEACRSYMLRFYGNIPFAPRHLDLYSNYFRALAETDGAVVVHCAAGKDRTGVICALTQHLAGVPEDDIVADYLLSNQALPLHERQAGMRAAIEGVAGRSPSEEGLAAMLSVAPEYLASAFAAMRQAHGSIDGYLEQALGLTPQLRAQVHDRLLG